MGRARRGPRLDSARGGPSTHTLFYHVPFPRPPRLLTPHHPSVMCTGARAARAGPLALRYRAPRYPRPDQTLRPARLRAHTARSRTDWSPPRAELALKVAAVKRDLVNPLLNNNKRDLIPLSDSSLILPASAKQALLNLLAGRNVWPLLLLASLRFVRAARGARRLASRADRTAPD